MNIIVTGDVLFRLVLGHLMGDYLFQTNWMALNKKSNIFAAILHCIIYTALVSASIYPELKFFKFNNQIIIIGLIFMSHFILDATTLIDRWLNYIGSRSFKRTEDLAVIKMPEQQMYIRAYTALVQTVADNTVHLFLMYLILRGAFLWMY